MNALALISGAMTAAQLMGLVHEEERHELAALLATERPLAQKQYRAIMRARARRQAGDVRGFERCRALAVELGERRREAARKIQAAILQWHALNTELNNATVRLDEPAKEPTT